MFALRGLDAVAQDAVEIMSADAVPAPQQALGHFLQQRQLCRHADGLMEAGIEVGPLLEPPSRPRDPWRRRWVRGR